ncbi:hypothetical protein [Myroides sp. DF42-4-2]|uniref:hypothetical protein n=1 Tax=Myroides sp. DF42-4-2 TaxID=2746726 RepID=UPI002576B54D|nr:hypothetical protein [Myroides sp. DF42-4-2]MDM1409028.1 hypothetical protein [Myroides sp. DF42-4-2]
MKKIVTLVMLTVSSLAFSQEKITKLAPSVTKLVIQREENIQIENRISLQDFIENIYINSSQYFNEGALPLVEKGEFNVILLDKDSKQINMKSSDFKDYTPDDIKAFTFEKSVVSRIYGLQGYYFGIVTIKLKEQ